MTASHIGNLGKDHNQIIASGIFKEPSHLDNELSCAPAAMQMEMDVTALFLALIWSIDKPVFV